MLLNVDSNSKEYIYFILSLKLRYLGVSLSSFLGQREDRRFTLSLRTSSSHVSKWGQIPEGIVL
jgi:hypothetical protein